MYKIVLKLMVLLALFSCSKQVTKQKTTTKTEQKTRQTFTDTSKVTTSVVQEKVTHYGDTLQGNIFLTSGTSYDSIESVGIKVIAQLSNKDGIQKIHLRAIAKPQLITEKTAISQTQQNDIHNKLELVKNSLLKNENKEKQVKGFEVPPWYWWLILLVLILFGFTCYKANQSCKRWW